MPDEARCRRIDGSAPWSVQDELLALLIEEVSITAAGMNRKKPITIPRPDESPSAATPTARKHGGLFEAALTRGGSSG